MANQQERDPFARTSVERETVPVHDAAVNLKCAWCGSRPRRLYRYYRRHDGGRVEPFDGLFCNKSCRDSYHS